MSELIVIDDSNYLKYANKCPDGQSMGLIPRDYAARPVGYYSDYGIKPFPDAMLISRAEWADRLAIQKKNLSRQIDVRNRGDKGKPIPALDQNGKGYCWAHSTVTSMRLLRAAMNEPFADLSAYAIACVIKNYANQGGYNAQSVKFAAERGCPTSALWPMQSMDRKLKDDPKVWENAAKYKITEWYDLEPGDLDQFVSAMLHGMFGPGDYNWWGHSVGTMGLESIGTTTESLVSWILNSWGTSWSQNGAGQLKGRKAIPDGCIVTTNVLAAAA